MVLFTYALVLYLFGICADIVLSAGCNINLQNDLPTKNDPVYLVKDASGTSQLAFPNNNGTIELLNQQVFTLACTGSKNTLIASSQAVTDTKCSSGTTLSIGTTNYQSSDLNCTSRSAASLLITSTKCFDQNSVIIQSGFQVGNNWFYLVETCHNINESNSQWSKHILYGSKLAGRVFQSARPGFSRGDKQLFPGFDPDVAYQQSNQEDAFARIYGNQSASKYIVRNQVYLSRGHLSPDADFLYGSWQMLTYFYVNVAPQWQSINAGNWLSVENNARKLAMNLQKDILDITGTRGILSLTDDNGVLRQAFLQGNKLAVPEIVWKLLRNPEDNSCIAFLVVNNPHLQSNPDPICPDICASAGWPVLQSSLTKGYIYCCDYTSFRAVTPQAPAVTCSSVLNFK